MSRYERQRLAMVRRQLGRRGIRDPAVLEAMSIVPREEFLTEGMQRHAYEDCALPIEHGQTISQPYMVGLMADMLELSDDQRVLEIGTGSGYAAAVLSRLAGEVHTVERFDDLASDAAANLRRLDFVNVFVHVGDGSLGWPEHAPYDAIVVAAAGPRVPRSLLRQLRPGGRLLAPVGPANGRQRLVRVRRTETGFDEEELAEVRFVPLVGEEGWEDVAT